MEGKELKTGEYGIVNEVRVKCVKFGGKVGCSVCAFKDIQSLCDNARCCSVQRSDGQGVVFIKAN